MKKLLALGIAVVGMAFGTVASADQIVGSISMTGGFTPDTGDLATADAIDFDPAGGTTGSFIITAANDNLSVYAGGTGGTIKDFTFNPFSGPIFGFYTITVGANTLTFDLSTAVVSFQSSLFLAITGTGTMYSTGYDATPGTWNFTGQTATGGTEATFSWSATSGANPLPVPEPATLALLGLGLAGLGFARRRKS